MRVIVSIHDITPGRLDEATAWRDAVRRVTPGPVSLLVIPRYAGTESWRRGPGAARMVHLARGGDEVVVHGYAHTRRGRDGAESAGRDAPAVTRLVADGARELRAVGLTPTGFIAPAYGHAAGIRAACAGAGLAWWAGRRRLWTPDGDRSLPSVGLGASTRARRFASPTAARALAALLARAPVVRLDLHTADIHHRRLARAGLDLLARMIDAGRVPVTHGALIAGAHLPAAPAPRRESSPLTTSGFER